MLIGRIVSLVMMLGGVIMASVQCSTANFGDVQLTTGIDDYQPIDEVEAFDTDQETVFVAGELRNAPSGTEISAEWYYMEDEETYIDGAMMETGSTDFYFSLSQPDDGWPEGSYEVRLYINNELEETLPFTIE